MSFVQPNQHEQRHLPVKTATTRSKLVRCVALLCGASIAVACTSQPVRPTETADTRPSQSATERLLTSSSITTATSEVLAGSSTTLTEHTCASDTGTKVNAPLAAYGNLDSATLSFSASAPPAALLCATFTSNGVHQQGSAESTTGHLAYLFSQVNPTKVSSGGGYFWISGAVDSTATSVVLSFSGSTNTSPVELVALTAGWRGFAYEYSPGPGFSAPPADATVTVSALDANGSTVATRGCSWRS